MIPSDNLMGFRSTVPMPLFVFAGTNTHLLSSERRRWTQEFARKHGPENLTILQGSAVTLKDILDEIAMGPFIAESRLVVLENLPKMTKKDVEPIVDTLHPSVLLAVFVETDSDKPEKMTATLKELMQNATVKMLPKLSPAQLKTWVLTQTKELGFTLSADALTFLLTLARGDQALLANELRKLALYAGGRTLQKEDIDTLVVCLGEQRIWEFTNLLGAGRIREAHAYAQSLLRKGESPHGLWAMLLNSLSSLVLVASHCIEGEKRGEVIAKETGLNPWSIRSLMPLAQTLAKPQLQSIVKRISSADIALKTGGIRATSEAPEELLALLDVAVLSFEKK